MIPPIALGIPRVFADRPFTVPLLSEPSRQKYVEKRIRVTIIHTITSVTYDVQVGANHTTTLEVIIDMSRTWLMIYYFRHYC